MKSKNKLRSKSSRTPGKVLRTRRQAVRQMASQGLSGDVIAAKVGLNKNRLRATHAIDLHEGREAKRAERKAAEAISRKERERIEIITNAWNSEWREAVFHDCKTLEEALAQSAKHWR